MNFDQPCYNCNRPRGQHRGETHQGACPTDAALLPHTPYLGRCWRPAPRTLHGGGPWAISPDCPVRWHNTGAAAKGSLKTGRCECPRGVQLREEGAQKRKDQRAIVAIAAGRVPAHRRDARVTPTVDTSPVFEVRMPLPTLVRPPNFLGAACQQPWAAETVDRSFSLHGGTVAIGNREEMRTKVCATCPLIRECATWVLAAERPAGSWGGVYGGMDVWNRTGRELYVGIDAVHERKFSPLDYLASL